MKRNIIVMMIAMLLVSMMTACGITGGSQYSPEPSKTASHSENLRSAWIAYWNTDLLKDELQYMDNLNELSVFGVYYNEDGTFVEPNTLDIMNNQSSDLANVTKYISFINDVKKSDGTSLLKDTAIVSLLLTDTKKRTQHINDLVQYALANDYQGIEIDYEAIKDESLWTVYAQFIKELMSMCKENKLKLRVVLEPLIDFNYFKGIEDVEFVIMCYNLYGSFSGPGPKADKEFLQKVADRAEVLSGTVTMALATGGFDWSDDGVDEVTEMQANELSKNAEVSHDSASECATFSYQDAKGKDHEVWYADAKTITFWKNTLWEKGYQSFSLWRVGINEKKTIEAFNS